MDKLKLNASTQNSIKCIEDRQANAYLHAMFHTDIIEMVKSVPPKSCELDPIPMKILKDHIGAKIINTSFD